ncbi:MAG: site-specific DNA-methyltransferase [Corynebacterium sp.]|nr:site-specific DNA-methyltransferase [Corynebacterium sp.]
MTEPAAPLTPSEPQSPSTFTRGRIYHGDALSILRSLGDESVQAVVTSPPYWGLRDYGVEGQIGAEATIDEFIQSLVEVFREVRRVLKDDGVLWLNIGDGYTSGGRKWRDADKKLAARGMSYRPDTPEGMKPKDLIGVPWMLAFALRADGWYLRSDIIWNKPNANPESVRDRPTRSHEFIFMLSKSAKYYYNVEATLEPTDDGKKLRRKRSVWSIKTEPFKGAHFACFRAIGQKMWLR